jgi:N-acyl-D-amino-acid deacylase
MYSLIIKNARVIDGSGKPGEIFDVAVQGDEIVAIAKKITSNAETVLDGSGKILTPGFIDLQNHSDAYWQLFDNPQLDSLITQGFTTILVGNCGASLAPLLSKDSLLAIQKWHTMEGVNINWQSFSEYIETLSRSRIACNVASLVGYATLRRGLVGDQVRRLEKNETNALKKIVQESMDAGAFGLSSGLSYSHEIIISELELFDLAKVVAKEKGLFSIHLRNEGSTVVEAVEEALDIARTTEVNLKISHLKIRGRQNWSNSIDVLTDIDTAYHKGANVHFDVYPYDTIWQVLYSYLPKWAVEGGRTLMLRHFSDPVQQKKIVAHLNGSGVKFSDLIIASTANKLNFVGKTIGQIAKNMEVSSEQAVLHLIQNGGSEVLVFEKNLDPLQVEELLMHPLSFIGTDGGGFSKGNQGKLVHPRCFGTTAKFIKEIGLSKKLTLEETIQKLTSGPAKKIGLKKRGELKVGNFADMVLFNPQTLSDKATYENPYQFSAGIDYVFVNGKPVISQGQITGQLPGYALRKG